MAEVLLDLTHLIRINDRNLADVDVPNFLNNSPFMRTNAATMASQNTVHKFLRYTNPDTGFRNPNDGREVQTSQDALVSVDCKIIDASYRTDLALADEYRYGRQAWINREAGRALDSAFFEMEQQVFQGTGYDALGFDGFPQETTVQSIAGGMVVDGGSAAGTTNESVWLVRSGIEDVEIVTGMSGNIAVEPPTIQEVPGTTGTYPGIYVPITAWYALKIGSSVTSLVRIANLDNGSNNMTDALFYEAFAKFGTGRGPTHVYCSRRQLEHWRNDRTTYNPIGTPAPIPEMIQGVSIVPTDGIAANEAVIS